MKMIKNVNRKIKGQQAIDGARVRLVRVFGYDDVFDFDPFLMLDAFDSSRPEDYTRGFPWHPHRGIETITYLLDGEIEHGDSLGNKGVIRDGECQWMTAGSGIIHQEMPKDSPRLRGIQLWLNLPRADKMTTPKYHGIENGDIPVIEEEGAKIRILGGEYLGYKGAMSGNYVKPTYLDVELAPAASWSMKAEPEETLFVYVLEGAGSFGSDGSSGALHECLLFGEGDRFEVKSGAQGIRFLLLSGKPLKEPIAWGGPIVMNTREELEQAFRELDEDAFIR